MSDETQAKFYKLAKVLLIAASLLLIGNGIYHSCKGRSSTSADNNVNRTVESIKAANESARSELEYGSRNVEAAEKHVERAADAVSRSTEAAARNAGSVDQLEKIISESQGIVKAQRKLIQEIDRANGIGAQEGKEN